MTRDYELGRLIGAGTFGTVHEATVRSTGRPVAVKTITKRFTGEFLEWHFVRRVQHEVDIYSHMGNSLNVAHLYDVYEDDTCVDLVMEHCTGGELWRGIRRGDYSEADAARIVREVVRTVSQFHAAGVVMRDVKPENFLFAHPGPAAPLKAIDFGIAQYCAAGETLKERAGTPIYVAPEVLKMEYGQKADMWSAGIVAYQLLTGRLPFIGDNGLMVSTLYMTKQVFSNKDVFRAILYAELDFKGPPWPGLSQDAAAFVAALLTRDAARRPTADEALRHPWLAALDRRPAIAAPVTASGASDSGDDAPSAVDAAGGGGGLMDTVVQRLQRFGTYGRLKQVALRGVANVALTVAGDTEMLAEIRAAFAAMDGDGDGRVPYDAVVELLRRGDFDLSDTETEVLISQMDIEEEGVIRYDEWLTAMLEWRSLQESPEWEAWVEAAFRSFDVDGSGRIGVAALQEMLCRGGICAMPDTIASALREADSDGDGCISLDDFERLVALNRSDTLRHYGSRRRRALV